MEFEEFVGVHGVGDEPPLILADRLLKVELLLTFWLIAVFFVLGLRILILGIPFFIFLLF